MLGGEGVWGAYYSGLVSLYEECNQCGKCSSGCPAARVSDLRPRRVALLAQRGGLEELVGSSLIWECAQCHQCMERCPREVTPYDLIIYLQGLAVKRGLSHPQDLDVMFNAIKASSRIQGPKEVLDREFEEVDRWSLELPGFEGPEDLEAFRRALQRARGEEG